MLSWLLSRLFVAVLLVAKEVEGRWSADTGASAKQWPSLLADRWFRLGGVKVGSSMKLSSVV